MDTYMVYRAFGSHSIVEETDEQFKKTVELYRLIKKCEKGKKAIWRNVSSNNKPVYAWKKVK